MMDKHRNVTPRTPSKSYGSPRRGRGGKPRASPRGHFQDGMWYCNCQPRVQAAHRQVKKEGPNTGRWFFCCPKPQGADCGLFQWDNSQTAQSVDMGAFPTRIEPDFQIRVSSPSFGEISPPIATAAASAKTQEPAKRTIEVVNTSTGDVFGLEDWDILGWAEGRELPIRRKVGGQVEESPPKVAPSPKSSHTMNSSKAPARAQPLSPVTPLSKRKRQDEIPITPRTGQEDEDLLPTQNVARRLFTPRDTPTSVRAKEVPESPFKVNDYEIMTEVFSALKSENISEEASSALRDILQRHTRRVQGVVMARDVCRSTVKAKTHKIAELGHEIADLGHKIAELEMRVGELQKQIKAHNDATGQQDQC